MLVPLEVPVVVPVEVPAVAHVPIHVVPSGVAPLPLLHPSWQLPCAPVVPAVPPVLAPPP